MVFMEDSERAASVALAEKIDAGLHLNLTSRFTAKNCPARLADRHERIAAFLRRASFAQMVFHPGLISSFEYVVNNQVDEFQRLYGQAPRRIDGHHHMHLCANVMFGGLLPAGTVVRRNFSFQPGQKSVFNRIYRRAMDGMLARRHKLTDYFFSLPPLAPADRLDGIFALAHRSVVEVETHPINPDEYAFLTRGGMLASVGELAIAPAYIV
jgi:hypothetical protein